MSTSDMSHARDKAARLLRRRGSASSMASTQQQSIHHQSGIGPRGKHGSMSTVSYNDTHDHDNPRIPVKMEPTYQMEPAKKFPTGSVQTIISDVLSNYLQEEKYEPEMCRQMTKTISEVVKARVKDLMVPRYKVICVIHIGQKGEQGIRVGSRCLWDSGYDTFATSEFRNNSLFAIGTVYAVYHE
ncbi:unnamed protein product [Owenia fusiformis]|uniref:Uncharacterized protein n=1 Tax=Owenia fusiformis TaxID=6347 RepID=A0A8S4N4N9_OWEFU|nr:unnamed protein product [Owenia fusiformis]